MALSVAGYGRCASLWFGANSSTRTADDSQTYKMPGGYIPSSLGAELLAATQPIEAPTTQDSTIRGQLLASIVDATSSLSLSSLTGMNDWSTNPPQYLAVRSGAGVTSEFSGGSQTFGSSMVLDNNVTVNTTYFAGGTAPNAFKGAAVTAAAQGGTPTTLSADQMQQATKFATYWLNLHLDDHQLADGSWNRPLVDASL